MPTGKNLINQINTTECAGGELVFWRLGQQSYVIKLGEKVIYIDPFLSDHGKRLIAPLLTAEEITNADLVLGTHDHRDHIDREELPHVLQASPRAKLVVPKKAASTLPEKEFPKERIVSVDDEESIEIDNIKITAIKAMHETFDHDSKYGYPYLQYIIQANGVTVYHTGDTLVYDGLAARLKSFDITAAFMPINGRDAMRLSRGCLGNMTWQEAADLAGEIKPKLVVPGHYEMFAGNMIDPGMFAEYIKVKYPELPFWLGSHGRPIRVSHK
jgi:L-ascorbate metabolism protein UlaG (beta-lactamase superfamily)